MDTNEPSRAEEERIGQQTQNEFRLTWGMLPLFALIGALLLVLVAFVPSPYGAFFFGLASLIGILAVVAYLWRPRQRGR